nr:STY0301 family protein [Telluria mixta]
MMRRILLVAAAPAFAAAQTVTCPEALPEAAVELKHAPEGWVASSPGVVRLDGGGMLSGAPKQMQYLVPTSSKKVKGGGASTWNFDPGEQKWLYCTYGKMAVQLAKRMDDKATTCEVTVTYERKDVIAGIMAFCR